MIILLFFPQFPCASLHDLNGKCVCTGVHSHLFMHMLVFFLFLLYTFLHQSFLLYNSEKSLHISLTHVPRATCEKLFSTAGITAPKLKTIFILHKIVDFYIMFPIRIPGIWYRCLWIQKAKVWGINTVRVNQNRVCIKNSIRKCAICKLIEK